MQIAVFSDVHANLCALEAILADIELQRVDRVICLGDLVGYGAFPNEAVDLVRRCDTATVMGNYDDAVAYGRADCGCVYRSGDEQANGLGSLAWTRQIVSEDNKAYLRRLPMRLQVAVNGVSVALVHGSPTRIDEYLFEDRPRASLERALDVAGADVLVCGHTHLPYHRVFGRRHLVNVGSIGKPKTTDPRACYALIDINGHFSVDFRFIAYAGQNEAQPLRLAA
jgi:putative phosphoesterase